MSEYIRKCIVVAGSEQGVRITDLRFKFTVTESRQAFPSTLKLEIYNLNRQTQTKFEKEFTKIFLFCGYVFNETSDPKLIFSGNIKNVVFRTDGKDVITTVYAGDSESDYKNATFSQTFQGNTALIDVIRKIAGSFKNVTIGNLSGLNNQFTSLRGFTESGKTAEILNKYSKTHQFDWYIKNGVFNTIPKNVALDKKVILIKSTSGLLDAPELTESGVNVKTLLNPDYFPRRRVKIDTSASRLSIQEASIVRVPRTKGNGIFLITKVVHTGDTRGDQWISNVECLFFN
jgi:hypothetical protein